MNTFYNQCSGVKIIIFTKLFSWKDTETILLPPVRGLREHLILNVQMMGLRQPVPSQPARTKPTNTVLSKPVPYTKHAITVLSQRARTKPTNTVLSKPAHTQFTNSRLLFHTVVTTSSRWTFTYNLFPSGRVKWPKWHNEISSWIYSYAF
jgi:hypothetical protein